MPVHALLYFTGKVKLPKDPRKRGCMLYSSFAIGVHSTLTPLSDTFQLIFLLLLSENNVPRWALLDLFILISSLSFSHMWLMTDRMLVVLNYV